MNCETAQSLLSQGSENPDLESHVDSCGECCEFSENFSVLQEHLHSYRERLLEVSEPTARSKHKINQLLVALVEEDLRRNLELSSLSVRMRFLISRLGDAWVSLCSTSRGFRVATQGMVLCGAGLFLALVLRAGQESGGASENGRGLDAHRRIVPIEMPSDLVTEPGDRSEFNRRSRQLPLKGLEDESVRPGRDRRK